MRHQIMTRRGVDAQSGGGGWPLRFGFDEPELLFPDVYFDAGAVLQVDEYVSVFDTASAEPHRLLKTDGRYYRYRLGIRWYFIR